MLVGRVGDVAVDRQRLCSAVEEGGQFRIYRERAVEETVFWVLEHGILGVVRLCETIVEYSL